MARSGEHDSSSRAARSAADSPAARVLSGQDDLKAWQEDLYRSLHQHPELSDQEVNTARTAAADRASTVPEQSASEDFSIIPDALGVPYTFGANLLMIVAAIVSIVRLVPGGKRADQAPAAATGERAPARSRARS